MESREDELIARARRHVGQVLQAKWKLDALLGVGGMAAVYAATHRNSKRVAVKVLHPDCLSSRVLDSGSFEKATSPTKSDIVARSPSTMMTSPRMARRFQ